jgi:hypothetical protein
MTSTFIDSTLFLFICIYISVVPTAGWGFVGSSCASATIIRPGCFYRTLTLRRIAGGAGAGRADTLDGTKGTTPRERARSSGDEDVNVTALKAMLRSGEDTVAKADLVLPSVVVGTFQLKGEVVKEVIRHALAQGARAIDTASVYRNEAEIGLAIRDSGVLREHVFITSKLGPSEQGYEAASQAIRASLERLQTTYLDLYLIHWPGVSKTPATSSKNSEERLGSWRALEEAQQRGLARHIGVSNFEISHLEELQAHARVLPAVNQVEFHPGIKIHTI